MPRNIALPWMLNSKTDILVNAGPFAAFLGQEHDPLWTDFTGPGTRIAPHYTNSQTRDYHDPNKRSIANALTVELEDGTRLDEVVVEYPIGHKRRRADGIPLLEAKFRTNLARRFPARQQQRILEVSLDQRRLEAMPVHDYVDLYVI